MDQSVPSSMESRTRNGPGPSVAGRQPQHAELQLPNDRFYRSKQSPLSASSASSTNSGRVNGVSSDHSRQLRFHNNTTTSFDDSSARVNHGFNSPFSSAITPAAALPSLMTLSSSSSTHTSSERSSASAGPLAGVSTGSSRRRLDPYSSLRSSSHSAAATTAKIDSPFLSPVIRREPLVLDPSSSGRNGSSSNRNRYHSTQNNSMGSRTNPSSSAFYHNNTSTTNDHRHRSQPTATIPSVQTLIRGIRDHHATAAATTGGISGQLYQHLHSTTKNSYYSSASSNFDTATIMARSSVQAGFMQKLGVNIPEFKRRFFVLKPESNLYYFLSPNDTEPRGRIDLEGATSIEPLPDEEQDGDGGSYRFVITWGEGGNERDDGKHATLAKSQQHQVVLEARSKEIGEEWIRQMKSERVSTLKERNEELVDKTKQQENRIAELEKQVEQFRMVEKDRDGALEDARDWKNKFGSLDEALRLLTLQIRKAPSINTNISDGTTTAGDANQPREDQPSITKVDDETEESEEKKEDDEIDDGMKNVSEDTDQTPTQSNRRAALLDGLSLDDVEVEEILRVPGTYFSALANSCRQQRESLKLASIEAATAVNDVLEANERFEVLQKRMQKAEKQILKLWEENCTIRNTLKQKKREKRVLVKEVKQLQQRLRDSQKMEHSIPTRTIDEDGQMADTMIGSDEEEERLITELEEHVASSIRLHERLVAGRDTFDMNDHPIHGSSTKGSAPSTQSPMNVTVDHRGPSIELKSPSCNRQSSRRSSETQIQSLLDDDSDDSDAECTDLTVRRNETIAPTDDIYSIQSVTVSSTGQEMCDAQTEYVDSLASEHNYKQTSSFVNSDACSPERINPLLQLDSDDASESSRKVENMLKSQRLFRTVSETGQATSRLACPLVDVIDTNTANSHNGRECSNDNLNIYHLTFYSKKIGIQFQKAPPAPVKPRGLLTDAMTADLFDGSDGKDDKTAAELKNVASIASISSGNQMSKGSESCPLALPVDIVLVCGFDGFDDSGNNQRPKLGARLVAFDGISVEIGKWTFDGIRKAIKARGRPLTLSFRDDFLTTEQRITLTRAVMEVDAKTTHSVPRPVIRCERRPSATPSLTSALSHDSEHFSNHPLEGDSRLGESRQIGVTNIETDMIKLRDPDESFYGIKGDGSCCLPSLSSHSSLSSRHRHEMGNLHSFSDAGSSTVLSTTLAPLMANLLQGVSERQQCATSIAQQGLEPEYLKRQPTHLEGTPQHEDFKSNLL